MKKFFLHRIFILCAFVAQGQSMPETNLDVNTTTETDTFEQMELKLKEQLSLSGFRISKEKIDIREIPEVYSFDWKYIVRVNSKKGEKIIHYLIKKDAPYFGIQVPNSQGMIAVIDTSKKLTILFTDSGKIKNISATKNEEILNISKRFVTDVPGSYQYKKIGRKYLLGLESSGYQTENKEGIYTFYLTFEPGVNFPGIFLSELNHLPADYDRSWLTEGKGLLMLMTIEGRKKAKNNITLTCVGLEKNNLVLEKKNFLAFTNSAEKN